MRGERRVALVTGAGRGLGLEIARQLATTGVHVAVTARDESKADYAAQTLMRDDLPVCGARLDVVDAESIAHAIDALPPIDILINNAGISDGAERAATITDAKISDVLDVNLLGAWRCSAAVIPTMRRRGYGRIVNISSRLSSLATMTSGSEPAYRVSKAALNGLTRVLAADLLGTGILVNTCSPGWVRTDLGGPNAPTTVEEGADTPVWLATLPDDGPSGGFFADRHPTSW